MLAAHRLDADAPNRAGCRSCKLFCSPACQDLRSPVLNLDMPILSGVINHLSLASCRFVNQDSSPPTDLGHMDALVTLTVADCGWQTVT